MFKSQPLSLVFKKVGGDLMSYFMEHDFLVTILKYSSNSAVPLPSDVLAGNIHINCTRRKGIFFLAQFKDKSFPHAEIYESVYKSGGQLSSFPCICPRTGEENEF